MYPIAIYILLSFIIFILFALFSYKFQFVDVPNDRKIHSKPTAYSGGIAISIILLCALQFFETFNILDRKLNLILSTAFLTSVIGFIDDRYHLNVGGKLSLQIVPIFYLITFPVKICLAFLFNIHRMGNIAEVIQKRFFIK